jgi:predicted transcriptional regulator
MSLRPPCEVVVRSVLPAFRSLVARSLIEDFNFSQVAAAKKLGTTQASISHYLYSKRGEKMVKQLEDSASVLVIVNEIAEGIAADKISPLDAMLQFCRLCEALRSGDMICDWHKNCLDVPDTCNVCPTSAKKNP